MNKSNREVINDYLMAEAETNKEIVVLTSDSRGSAKLGSFAEKYPSQFVETGIAEQNIVGIAAGLAHSGKIPFVASPASFLSMRSIEQIKVDCAYSNTNVKLIGISGGVSYGALGMSHHSVQDIAIMRAIPNMTVIIPADEYETEAMMKSVIKTTSPTYIRIGRNPVKNVYENAHFDYEIGKVKCMKEGNQGTIIACGEMVEVGLEVAKRLDDKGISVEVLNMHTIKPLDTEAVIEAVQKGGFICTIEEHSIYGGLGGAVAEIVSRYGHTPLHIKGIPDEPAVAGTSEEIFKHYGLTGEAIADELYELYGAREEL